MPKSIPSFRRLLPFGLAALVALLVGAVPSHAGTVYVPLTVQMNVDGISLETQVWLTNSTGHFAKAEVVFIPLASDGTKRKGAEVKAKEIPVWAGTTVRYDPLTNGPAIGLLEITLPDGVYATARLAGEHPLFGHALGTEVPVVTSANLIAAGGTAQVQGWQREANGVVTDFGLVNLSHQANSCQVSVFNGGGAQVKSSVLLPIKPLSMVHFTDALGILGESNNPNARAEVTCDGEFYPFSLLSDFRTGETLFLTPSGSGESALSPPGQAPKAPQCSSGATHCFTIPGLVFRAAKGNFTTGRTFPVPKGTYRKVHAQFKLKNGGWHPRGSSLRYMVLWMAQNGRNRDLFAYSFYEGPNKNKATLRYGFNSEHGDKTKFPDGLVWPVGTTYIVDYVYDTETRVVVQEIRKLDGTVLSRIVGKPDVNRLVWDKAGNITAGFGNEDINPAEPAQFGWEWRDWVLEIW